MTTSPYDSLPSGNNDTSQPSLEYIEVEIPQLKPLPKTPAKGTTSTSRGTPAAPKAPSPPKPVKTTPLIPPPEYDKTQISNYQGSFEYLLPFEESLLVPDTMPDMNKILFAEARIDLSEPAKTNYGPNDILSGSITAYTVYGPSDRPVDVIKSTIPFKTDKCWGTAKGDSFKVSVCIKNIYAEMTNERKFVVKGNLLIKMTGISTCDLKLFKSSSEKGLIFSSGTVNATDLAFETTDTIDISQDITVKDSFPAPVKILKTDFRIVENHRQITSNKLVINASIHSQILYKGSPDDSHDNGKEFFCISNKTDFTQFIAAEDITDPSMIKISYSSKDLEVSIESKDKFLLKGTITALIHSYHTKTFPVINDAYHKEKELLFNKTSQDMVYIGSVVNGEISSREVAGAEDLGNAPYQLLCGSCDMGNITSLIDNDHVTISGSCHAKILVLDNDGHPFVLDHDLPLRGLLDLPHTRGSAPDIYTDASIKEFWFTEINSRQIELNVTIAITMWAVTKETLCTIEDLRFAEKEESAKKTAMAIYVVGKEDTLWDVAKRYRIDPEAVAALNDLDPLKPLAEGMKLFLAK